MNRLTVVRTLPKLQRLLPPRLSRLVAWPQWQDVWYADHWLAHQRRQTLDRQFAACRTPGDFYDFAAQFFPPHQIRHEILSFIDLARSIEPRAVMEIGTAEGGTNFLLGAALPSATLKIGVDLFVRNTRLLKAYSRPGCEQLFVHGSSHAPPVIKHVRALLGDRPLDVLFIDGDHSYEGAKADFEGYLPLVRSGGLIAFHDIVPDHKARYGRDTGRWAGDVPRLWKEIRAQYAMSWELVEDPEQDGLGIGVIQVP